MDDTTPTSGYHIEWKDIKPTDEWTHGAHIDSDRFECCIRKLSYGIEYQFRLIALNEFGSSNPGFPSAPTAARPLLCKSVFCNRDTFQIIRTF